MKKILISILLLLFIFNIGCSYKINSVLNNLSELQLTYFIYEDENYSISLISGIREKDYELNGISTENKNYCVLMLEQLNFKEISSLNIRINGKDNFVSPLLNPYNNNYVYDLEISIAKDSLISIAFEDNFFTLNNIAINFNYDYKQCLKKIIKDEKLINYFNGGDFIGEVFIRLIKLKDFDNIFYQIVFVIDCYNSTQYIISPYNLENLSI